MATVLGLSHQTSLGTQPKNSKALTMPSRIASVALEGEGQNERSVRVGPSRDQEGNLPPAIGEIDVDVAKIGLEALAWQVPQRDERLAMATPVLVHIALHLAVTSVVPVFILQATKHLHGGVALFGGAPPRRRVGSGR